MCRAASQTEYVGGMTAGTRARMDETKVTAAGRVRESDCRCESRRIVVWRGGRQFVCSSAVILGSSAAYGCRMCNTKYCCISKRSIVGAGFSYSC